MKKKNLGEKTSKIWKILGFVIFISVALVTLVAIHFFISSQIDQLRALKFSDGYKDQFLESDKNPVYSGDLPFTLLLMVEYDGNEKDQIDGFVVVQVNPISNSATVISVHPNIYIYSTVYCIDFDETRLVRLRDLFVVGDLETPPKSCAYATYSIEELLAVHIDGYLWVRPEHLEGFVKLGGKSVPHELFEDGRSYEDWSSLWNNYWIGFFDSVSLWNVWKNRAVIPKLVSNMDVVDLYSFIDEFKSVKSDQIYSVSISDEDMSDVVNNKGDVVDLITSDAIDDSLNGYLEDVGVDREQARVELFNGSQVNGLGARYKRWLEHLGVDVIRVQNAPGQWEKTTIYVTDLDAFDYTLKKIVRLWGNDVKVIENRPDFITTGDIIIVLGLDFSQY